MATITGFKFDTVDGAEKMVDLVKNLSKQYLITLDRRGHNFLAGRQEKAQEQTSGRYDRPTARWAAPFGGCCLA